MAAITNGTDSYYRVVVFLWLALTVLPVAYAFSFVVINLMVILLLYYYLISSSSINFVINKMVALLPIYLIPFFNNCISFGGHQPIYMFLYGVLQNLLLPLIVLVLVKNKDIKNARYTLTILFIFLLITSVTTYMGNDRFPGVSRELAGIWGSNPELGMLYKSMNIGGFEFIYTITLALPILIGLIRHTNTVYKRIYFIIPSIAFIVVIIKSEYGLALAFSALAVLALLIKSWNSKKLVILFVGGIIGYYIAGSMLVSIIGHFADTTESAIFAERFGDMSSILSGEEVSDKSDVSIRQSLYLGSWKVFLENPITGDPHNKLIGGHSVFFDALANYGFIGLILMLWSIRTMYNAFIKPWKASKYYYLFVFVLMLQIALLFLNTTWLYQVFYLIIPLVGFLSCRESFPYLDVLPERRI